jgi:hypothetical protein
MKLHLKIPDSYAILYGDSCQLYVTAKRSGMLSLNPLA